MWWEIRSSLQENRKTLLLAEPIVAGQVSQMLLGFADTVIIGQVGTVELATAAFVNTLFHMAFVVSIGLFVAVSVEASHAFGSNRHQEAGEALRHGVLGGVLLGAVLADLLIVVPPFFRSLRPARGGRRVKPKLSDLVGGFAYSDGAYDGAEELFGSV